MTGRPWLLAKRSIVSCETCKRAAACWTVKYAAATDSESRETDEADMAGPGLKIHPTEWSMGLGARFSRFAPASALTSRGPGSIRLSSLFSSGSHIGAAGFSFLVAGPREGAPQYWLYIRWNAGERKGNTTSSQQLSCSQFVAIDVRKCAFLAVF